MKFRAFFFTKEKQKEKNKRKIKEKKNFYTNKTRGRSCHWEKGSGVARGDLDSKSIGGDFSLGARGVDPSSGTHLWTPHPPPDYQ
jgi:hypothetical protein